MSTIQRFRIATLVVVLASSLGSPLATSVEPSAQDDTRQIQVNTPRPLAEALTILEKRHGILITYEDPRYAHQSDVSDVTLQVRQDLDQYEEGEAPQVLIPRYGILDLTYPVSSGTGNLKQQDMVIQMILDAHVAQGNPGVFRLNRTGNIYHVIPAAVTQQDGDLGPEIPILDTSITFEAKERSGLDSLEAICSALTKTTGEHVTLGLVPVGILASNRSMVGAEDESARGVLLRVLTSTRRMLSWQLFYDPSLKWHVLNVHLVPSREKSLGASPESGPGQR